MELLKVDNLVKKIDEKNVLNGIHFTAQKGERIGIAGETGSGKSSLLRMIAGLDQPYSGNIYFDGSRVKGSNEQLVPGHPSIAYLSQHFELRNNYFVHEILSYANELTAAEANTLYEHCHITHLLKRRTHELSGGEKQRVALARILVASPTLLLLDEPYSNLDAIHADVMKKLIRGLTESYQLTIIMVSHDTADLLSWANTIILMKEGGIRQMAIPEVTYFEPVDTYCAALLGTYMLMQSPQKNTSNKKIFLRPSSLQLVNASEGDFSGVVTSIGFTGTYHVQVLVGEQELMVPCYGDIPSIGSRVGLTFARPSHWYL